MNIKAECINGKIKVYTNVGSKIVDNDSIHVKEILEAENEIELLDNEKKQIINDVNSRYNLVGRLSFLLPTILFLVFEFFFLNFFALTNAIGKVLIIPFVAYFLKKIKNNMVELLISKKQALKPVEFIDKDITNLKNKIKELNKKPKYVIYRNSEKIYIDDKTDVVENKIDLYGDYVLFSSEYKKAFLNSTLREWLINNDFDEETIERFIRNVNDELEDEITNKLIRRR